MHTSQISKKAIPAGEAVKCGEIRQGILKLIQSANANVDSSGYISIDELNQYRRLYLTSLIEEERGDLAIIDRDVMDAIKNNSILSENIQDEMEGELTLGQRLADSKFFEPARAATTSQHFH